MKKLIMAAAVCAAIATAMAADVKPPAGAHDAKAQERRERMLKATGGLVTKPGIGKIAVINAQDAISDETIRAVVDKLVFQTQFNVEVFKGEVAMYAPPTGFRAAVVLANDPNLPLSLVAVENLWGLVNVAKLGDRNVEARFTKEFIRVTTFAFGASRSQFSGSPLSSADSAEMLDRHVTDNYTFDCQQNIIKNLTALGMAPATKATYKKACEEGWAAKPENEYQQAIWDKVHSLPTEPLRIAPETTRQK